MTVRTFWTIFIKILGLWLVLDSITILLQFISTLISIGSSDSNENVWLTITLIIFTILIYGSILRIFVFKTAWLINVLHLEKGFEEEKIDINIHFKPILLVTIIVFGGFLFIDSFPMFCKQLFSFYQQKAIFRQSPNSTSIILYLVKSIIAIILITNGKFIVNAVAKKSSIDSNN